MSLQCKHFVSQAECENQLLRSLQASVEALYVHDRPLHHLDGARRLEFNGSDRQHSSVFVVEYDDFVNMNAAALQRVFRDRHILVLNTPSEIQEFSLESLCKLGSIDQVRQIQGSRVLRSICPKLTRLRRSSTSPKGIASGMSPRWHADRVLPGIKERRQRKDFGHCGFTHGRC